MSVIIEETICEASDDITVVKIHIFYAAIEIFVDYQTILYILHPSNIQIPIQVQLVKIALDSVSDTDSVHGQDDIPK